MLITNDIKYIGVNDREKDLFEGQFEVPNGMAYNSYIIMDEKIAVCDTVDYAFGDEWLANIKRELGERTPDYLIIHHMEPDHSSNIQSFAKTYPEAVIVAGERAFPMMKKFYKDDYATRRLSVKDGDTLSLGKHTLTFYTAPMVHWPEVIVSYDNTDKVLFSADAFGKFGALDCDEDWACEARRYYFGIVGKYGAQVQALFKKIEGIDISIICPLHGPVLSENLSYYLSLYNTWSAYGVESEGVLICYTSVYGNTKAAVELMEKELYEAGCEKVCINDLARCDMAEAVEDAFRYGRIILATTTYNGDIFPFMREFINELCERGYQNRRVGFIENGSWAPVAKRKMAAMLEGLKNMSFAESAVTIHSAISEKNIEEIRALAKEITE